jgi:hypothetical protein
LGEYYEEWARQPNVPSNERKRALRAKRDRRFECHDRFERCHPKGQAVTHACNKKSPAEAGLQPGQTPGFSFPVSVAQ